MNNPFFHSVAIQKREGTTMVFFGSGVLLKVKGQDYIVSAAHVVDDLPDEVGIAVVRNNEIRGFRDQPRRFVAEKQQDGTYKSGLDLAFLSVTGGYREFIEKEGMSFFDLDKNKPPPVTGECLISGFPARKNNWNSREKIYAETCGCVHIQSFMEDRERVRAIEADPEFHFALETRKRGDFWDSSTNQKIPELYDLRGMSGGGVWHMAKGQGALIPNCATAIAGILIQDRDTKNDRQGLALVVKIEAIRNIIEFAV